jgi:peptidoglycan/LPS O-acetylase OafA/YrhL
MLPTVLFGLFIILLAGGMYALHVRARQAAEHSEASERDVDFARRRFRRRAQVCLLLGVVGAAIIGGNWMNHPLLAAGYWLCVLALLGGMAILAVVDLIGSRTHFQTLHDEQAVERAALRAELEKYLPAKEVDALAGRRPES